MDGHEGQHPLDNGCCIDAVGRNYAKSTWRTWLSRGDGFSFSVGGNRAASAEAQNDDRVRLR